MTNAAIINALTKYLPAGKSEYLKSAIRRFMSRGRDPATTAAVLPIMRRSVMAVDARVPVDRWIDEIMHEIDLHPRPITRDTDPCAGDVQIIWLSGIADAIGRRITLCAPHDSPLLRRGQ